MKRIFYAPLQTYAGAILHVSSVAPGEFDVSIQATADDPARTPAVSFSYDELARLARHFRGVRPFPKREVAHVPQGVLLRAQNPQPGDKIVDPRPENERGWDEGTSPRRVLVTHVTENEVIWEAYTPRPHTEHPSEWARLITNTLRNHPHLVFIPAGFDETAEWHLGMGFKQYAATPGNNTNTNTNTNIKNTMSTENLTRSPDNDEPEDATLICPVTGNEFPESEGHEGPDGILVHPDIEDSYVWSDPENQWVDRDDALQCGSNQEYYSPGNAEIVWAEDQDEYWERDYCTRFDGNWYTDDYLDYQTIVCENCGDRAWADDAHSDGHGNYYCCEGCRPEDNGPIRDYSCKEASHYAPKSKDPLKFGLEIEVEVGTSHDRAEAAQDVLDALPYNYAICKEDGSLDRGFEIVTRPDSLQVHREILEDALPDFPSGLRAWDASTCGMHIHVSRGPLSGLQQGKVIVFVNHPGNAGFILAVAGRAANTYNERSEKKIGPAGKGTLGVGRYTAVNVTSKTLEFRIFRSSVKPATVLRGLEFCAALVAFCAPAERGVDESASHAEFAKFVRKNRKDYPNLEEFLIRKNYLPARPVKPTPNPTSEPVAV